VSPWRRLLLWLGVQLGLVDEVEDPRGALDLALARQVELQARARRAVADVVTARKRIELQARNLGPAVARLEEQAHAALQEGRQDAAREALTWRTALHGELTALDRQAASLAAEEARLRQATSRIDLQLQQLRVRRDALKASYEAARARAEVGKALAEASLEDSELLLALGDAEERIARTRAMADALEGLAVRGALEAAPAAGEAGASGVRRSEAEVADELARMEEELLWGPRALGEHHPQAQLDRPAPPPQPSPSRGEGAQGEGTQGEGTQGEVAQGEVAQGEGARGDGAEGDG
jgi:phage shock protein A